MNNNKVFSAFIYLIVLVFGHGSLADEKKSSLELFQEFASKNKEYSNEIQKIKDERASFTSAFYEHCRQFSGQTIVYTGLGKDLNDENDKGMTTEVDKEEACLDHNIMLLNKRTNVHLSQLYEVAISDELFKEFLNRVEIGGIYKFYSDRHKDSWLLEEKKDSENIGRKDLRKCTLPVNGKIKVKQVKLYKESEHVKIGFKWGFKGVSFFGKGTNCGRFDSGLISKSWFSQIKHDSLVCEALSEALNCKDIEFDTSYELRNRGI